jgi:hypothetical protein
VVRGWSSGSELHSGHANGNVTLMPGEPQVVFFFDTAAAAGPAEFRYRL